MKQKLIIYGCGGHARSVLNILIDNQVDYEIVFVDPNAMENEYILQFPVLKDYKLNGSEAIFVAVGDNLLRKEILENVSDSQIINVISPRAYLGFNVKLERGIFIGNNVHIGPDTRIEKGVIVNTGAIVEHEATVGKYAHIAPGSIVCGRCMIGEQVMVGVGGVIKDKISICDNAIIGAGGVVVKDIEESGVYVGVPSKKVR